MSIRSLLVVVLLASGRFAIAAPFSSLRAPHHPSGSSVVHTGTPISHSHHSESTHMAPNLSLPANSNSRRQAPATAAEPSFTGSAHPHPSGSAHPHPSGSAPPHSSGSRPHPSGSAPPNHPSESAALSKRAPIETAVLPSFTGSAQPHPSESAPLSKRAATETVVQPSFTGSVQPEPSGSAPPHPSGSAGPDRPSQSHSSRTAPSNGVRADAVTFTASHPIPTGTFVPPSGTFVPPTSLPTDLPTGLPAGFPTDPFPSTFETHSRPAAHPSPSA